MTQNPHQALPDDQSPPDQGDSPLGDRNRPPSYRPRPDPYRDHLNITYRLGKTPPTRREIKTWWAGPLATLLLAAPALVWIAAPTMVLGGLGTLAVLFLFGDLEWHIRPFWTKHWWTRTKTRTPSEPAPGE